MYSFESFADREMLAMYTQARYREVADSDRPTSWKGSFPDSVETGGNRLPHTARFESHPPDRVYPYWQAHLHNVQYLTD
jgi:hypothetical protein